MKKFNYDSVMQVPKLEKICLNRGVNGAVTDKKLVDVAVDELTIDHRTESSVYYVEERYFELQVA